MHINKYEHYTKLHGNAAQSLKAWKISKTITIKLPFKNLLYSTVLGTGIQMHSYIFTSMWVMHDFHLFS